MIKERFQKALRCLLDVQQAEDKNLWMGGFDLGHPRWNNPPCGSKACAAGWMEICPYIECGNAGSMNSWIADGTDVWSELGHQIWQRCFHQDINKGGKEETITHIIGELKAIYFAETGEQLTPWQTTEAKIRSGDFESFIKTTLETPAIEREKVTHE